MPMIDLRGENADAECILNKFSVKADGKDEAAFVYDLDLVFALTTPAEADVAGREVPGAREMFVRGSGDQDNEKFSYTVNPARSVRATVIRAKTDDKAIEGQGEITAVTVKGSKKAVVCLVKVRMGGQTEGVASQLTGCLRNAVKLSIVQAQPGLFDQPASDEAPVPEPGDVVVATHNGATVAGLCKAVGDAILVADFDGEYDVHLGDVLGFFGVEPANGEPMDKLFRSYRDRCKRRQLKPTWAALVLAMGQGQDYTGAHGARVSLGKEHIDGAVTLLERGDGSLDLPPMA